MMLCPMKGMTTVFLYIYMLKSFLTQTSPYILTKSLELHAINDLKHLTDFSTNTLPGFGLDHSYLFVLSIFLLTCRSCKPVVGSRLVEPLGRTIITNNDPQ